MILIDILQNLLDSIKKGDISSFPDNSKLKNEVKDLIVLLTANNIWTVQDLKNKLQNK